VEADVQQAADSDRRKLVSRRSETPLPPLGLCGQPVKACGMARPKSVDIFIDFLAISCQIKKSFYLCTPF